MPDNSRAVVLGGGGVLGLAWELGVLAGLLESEVDLSSADMIIGTSAGAFAGVALTMASDPDDLAAFAGTDTEIPAAMDPAVAAAYRQAIVEAGADPSLLGRHMGRIARQHPEPVPWARRRAVVERRLRTTDWPSAALQITATDADTGEVHLFDAAGGTALVDAAAASGAVPGIWPVERFGGRTWIDGGMASSTNSALAAGHDAVVILAPSPAGMGMLPGADAEADTLRATSAVSLLAPDAASTAAIGPNLLDPARQHKVASAGRAQGRAAAAEVLQVWSAGQ
ncbi:patatin-like phospholipase family protein [Kutzneria sp. NPDC052558]|uniref:patatin-like phospholipase family protein n=1 Tax=Kutzneria sp. NPDC052558 TaxID=3364121 RepID=UPI0037C7F34B